MTAPLARLRVLLDDTPLRVAIAAALLIGLLLPIGIASWLDLRDRRDALLGRLAEDHKRMADVLAIAMQTPIWDVRPDTAKPLVEAVMRDERVAAVYVTAPYFANFLKATVPERFDREAFVEERPVVRDQETIGRVRIEMTAAPLRGEISRQWQRVLLTAAFQFVLGSFLVFVLLRYKVLAPLRQLVGQARALAAGNLDTPVPWRRRDEIGVLGRTFEDTRRSLRGLLQGLHQRNAALQQSEEHLRASTGLLRATLDNMTDGITLVDGDLRLKAWNDRFCAILELPPGLVREGMIITDLHHYEATRGWLKPADRQGFAERMRSGFAPGQPWQTTIESVQGRVISIRRQPLADGGFVSTYTDITEPTLARRAAEESLQLLDAVMEAVPAALHVKDHELRYRLVNRAFLEMMGVSREAMIGHTLDEVFGRELVESFAHLDRRVLTSGQPTPFFETSLPLPGGGRRDTLTTKVPLIDGEGRVTHILTVHVDISARKAAEQALRESEARYRLLVDLSPYGVMVHDERGIVLLNPAGRRILGLRDDEPVTDRHYLDFVVPEERARAFLRIRRLFDKGESLAAAERRMIGATGQVFDASIAAVPLSPTPAKLALVMFRDISQQKRMERALADSEELYRLLVDLSPYGVLLHDREKIVFINPAGRRMLGTHDVQQIVGRNYVDFVAARERDEALDRLRRIIDKREMLTQTERRLIGLDGREIIVTTTGVPFRRGDQELALVIFLDISERKHAEAEIARQREALYQAEKMSALGSLLAGVAHELNNPLSVVVGRAIMLEEAPLTPSVAASVAKMRTAAERCARIVKTFLAMARHQAPTRALVDLKPLIEGALDLLAYGLRASGIGVSLDLPPRLPAVMGDPDQLAQVFNNLISNARQAMADGPPPRQLTIVASVDASGDRLRVRVADTGPGIPEAIRGRVFEPFFTTKPVGAGTGIGLSICQGIVEAHGGSITVDCPEAGGAQFTVSLPIASPAALPTPGVAPPTPTRPRGATVLIVDDERDIALMLADILAVDGHRALCAHDGREALAILARQRVDAVISDIVMPEIDGRRLFETIKSRFPWLVDRFVFTTGDTLSPTVRRHLAESGRPLLEKPFLPEDARRLIGHLLAAAAGDGAGSARAENTDPH